MTILEKLNNYLMESIPLAKFTGLEAISYQNRELELTMPLHNNDNDKGTGFAGSIYSAAVLGGWSSLWIICEEAGLSCDIAIFKSSSRFLRPVTDQYTITCKFNDADKILDEYNKNQRVNCRAKVIITSKGKICSTYTGEFAIRPKGQIR